MKSKTAEITAKYQRMIDNIQWHLKTNKPTDKMELQKCYQQINDYREMIVDLETVASQFQHPVPDESGEVRLKDVLLKYEIEFNRIGYTENAVEENSLLQAIDEYCFKISHNKNSEIMRLNGIIGKQQDSFNKLSDELKANYEIAQNPFTKRGIKIALKLFSKWILS